MSCFREDQRFCISEPQLLTLRLALAGAALREEHDAVDVWVEIDCVAGTDTATGTPMPASAPQSERDVQEDD